MCRDYRSDGSKGSQEIFFRETTSHRRKVDLPPVFQANGFNFIHIQMNQLYFVFTTRFNVSASYSIQLLLRIAKVFKDYCGVLNEESLRKNFVLVYELLDEVLDFGYPQVTSTEGLKTAVHNDPISVQVVSQQAASFGGFASTGIQGLQAGMARLGGINLPSFNPGRQVGQRNTTPSSSVQKSVMSKDSSKQSK